MDTDMDTDTDVDTDSVMKLANFCLASIQRYSPCSVVLLSDVISWRKSQWRNELVPPFPNENDDLQIRRAIGTAL
jgi:hypothetical protein